VDYIFVRLNLTYLPANNLRRISTMYVRGYLQGSENGRVVTIACLSTFTTLMADGTIMSPSGGVQY
jgi:hypothetical protein